MSAGLSKKLRADQLLVQQGLVPSRNQAQNLILAGAVFCGTEKVKNSSQLFSVDFLLSIKQKDHPFVSRGGVKLQGALDYFKLDARDKICLDVGASTGGFTDCLLKNGARKVYAVDVGQGQIDWSLRTDKRVVVIEKTNFRYFDVSLIVDPVDIAVVDVSFISLTKIILKIVAVFQKTVGAAPCGRLRKGNHGGLPLLIALIKPQFEVGREKVGKGGIVKKEDDRQECVKKISEFCIQQGFTLKGVIPSPILGQDGNQEILLAADFLYQ